MYLFLRSTKITISFITIEFLSQNTKSIPDEMILYRFTDAIRDLTANDQKSTNTEQNFTAALLAISKELYVRLIQYLKLPSYCCVCVSNHYHNNYLLGTHRIKVSAVSTCHIFGTIR